jgi:hypothetical protein
MQASCTDVFSQQINECLVTFNVHITANNKCHKQPFIVSTVIGKLPYDVICHVVSVYTITGHLSCDITLVTSAACGGQWLGLV